MKDLEKKEQIQPCGCTAEGDPIKWNPWNKVVQCHKCGAQYKLVASNNWFKRIRLWLTA